MLINDLVVLLMLRGGIFLVDFGNHFIFLISLNSLRFHYLGIKRKEFE